MHVVAEAFLDILRTAEGRALLIPGEPPASSNGPDEPTD